MDEAISYESLCSQFSREDVDEIAELIVDVLCSAGGWGHGCFTPAGGTGPAPGTPAPEAGPQKGPAPKSWAGTIGGAPL